MTVDLFRSDDLLVRAEFMADAAGCVVAFDHHGDDPSLDRTAFAERFLASRGLSWVAVLGRGNHWYHYPEMPAALAAIRAAVAGHGRVMTYGSSMGGFAALRFADAVGAHACLALSPQYSIRPGTVPPDDRWAQEAAAIRWPAGGEPPIACACVPVVAYDACHVDALHADRIAADTPIARLPLPHAGHPVGTALLAAGLLEPLVMATLAGEADVAAHRRRWREGRGGNPVYLAELGQRQPDRRLALGVELGRRALALDPGSVLLQHRLATLFSRHGDHADALALHEAAVHGSGQATDYAVALALALAAAGRSGDGLALARGLVAERPDNALLHSLVANLLWGRRERAEAIRSAACAAAMAPGSRHYAEALAWYRHRSHPWVRLRRWLATRARRLAGRPAVDAPPLPRTGTTAEAGKRGKRALTTNQW